MTVGAEVDAWNPSRLMAVPLSSGLPSAVIVMVWVPTLLKVLV